MVFLSLQSLTVLLAILAGFFSIRIQVKQEAAEVHHRKTDLYVIIVPKLNFNNLIK